MSKAVPKPLDLKKFLPYRLSIVTNKVSYNLGCMYADKFGMSTAEWRVMAVLGQEKDLSAEEVCTKTEMDKVTVSRAVTRMIEKKHIIRKFSEQDRRRSILRLSKSGYSIYTQIVPMARSYEAKLLEGFSKKEQQQLDQLLDKLNQQALIVSGS
ncbi:MAG: winged helix-turn-helix transcriptional regulator [Gammaproteobacteria bacterium]|jgi:DNA-binding MarR family transcriptional regulator|nr:winged helix-turn-helix transcriptional regulator [Gammaproteobacteria bacterium]